jgi:hypothetical protein
MFTIVQADPSIDYEDLYSRSKKVNDFLLHIPVDDIQYKTVTAPLLKAEFELPKVQYLLEHARD